MRFKLCIAMAIATLVPISAFTVAAVPDSNGPPPAASSSAPVRPADAALQRLAMRFLQACVDRDADYVAANSIDEPAGSFTIIGTGLGTDWSLGNFTGHLRGLKPVQWSGLEPRGYVLGDMAWFTDLAQGILPDGRTLDIRVTLIMRRVGSSWKVVHNHISEGVHRGGIRKE